MSDKTLIFQMTGEVALEFWTRVKERNLQTEKERKTVLLELVREGKMQSVVETGRTKEQIAHDYARHYNVLDLMGNERAK